MAGISDFGEDVVSEAGSASGGISGGVLRGKKDRDDRRKSYKTTLKNTKPQNLRTLKYTTWSKINLKNTNKPEFIKEAYSKELFLYPNKYQFCLFKVFCLNIP